VFFAAIFLLTLGLLNFRETTAVFLDCLFEAQRRVISNTSQF
jgi:hypothetical protein